MSIRDLDFVFRPRSIALVGASKTPQSVGQVLARNLMSAGFDGPIMPVNPRHQAIGGVLTWPDVESLPIVPDLGVVCTPADAVPGVVGALYRKGARGAVVITAGFGEGEEVQGAERRAAMLKAAGPMRIVGPNVLGIMVPHIGLNASFAHINALKGDLAFVAQSGALLTSVLDWATTRGIGFSHIVSLGGMADVDFGDMLDYLTLQPETRAILLYIEAVTNARKFMSAARMAARAKPVVVIKAGRAPEGAKAASSHTGALAGTDAVYDAAFRRAGMLRVYDMEELFTAVETLAHAREFRGNRLAILSNGGGMGVLATDRAAEEGCRMAALSEATMAALDRCLPPTWSHGNPVDIIGDAPGARYGAALDALLEDEGVDAVLVLNCPTAVADGTDAARAILERRERRPFPVLTSWVGGRAAEQARALFAEHRVPTYDTPEAGVRAVAHLDRYRRNQDLLLQVPTASGEELQVDRDAAARLIDNALSEGREWLTEPEAKAALKAYGIPAVETLTVASAEEAEAAAARMQPPFALKILSSDISHKSDVGGVMLDLGSAAAVAEAARSMRARVAEAAPKARLEGFTLQPMVRRRRAVELILGISEDPQFGPVVLFGEGGTKVEVVADTAMALPPLDAVLARALIEETRIARLLRGYRDRPAADIEAIVGVLIRIARLAVDHDALRELDINPLLADAEGAIALDARVRVRAPQGPPRSRLAIRPYPDELIGTVALRDGGAVPVRPIRPTDAPRLQDMIRRADLDDIRLRFMHAMKALPDKLAARLSQIDYAREMAFVATDPADENSAIGVARLAADPDGTRAEYAVMVRSDWKGKGLGYALMERLIAYARARGVGELFGEVLTENARMLKMCRELGFMEGSVDGQPDIRRVTLTLS